jgi:hypothetical protein
MDDFLHNLRSGNLRKSNTGNRRPYGDQHGKHPNRRVIDRRQKDGDQRLTTESLETIKEVLQQLTAAQQQLATAQEQRAVAEARTAAALESIAASLKAKTGATTQAPEKIPVKAPAPPATASDADTMALSLEEKISALRAQKLSYARIGDQLNQEGVPTPSGRGQWRGATVQRVFQRHSQE